MKLNELNTMLTSYNKGADNMKRTEAQETLQFINESIADFFKYEDNERIKIEAYGRYMGAKMALAVCYNNASSIVNEMGLDIKVRKAPLTKKEVKEYVSRLR